MMQDESEDINSSHSIGGFGGYCEILELYLKGKGGPEGY
jgi:hypothetical protein